MMTNKQIYELIKEEYINRVALPIVKGYADPVTYPDRDKGLKLETVRASAETLLSSKDTTQQQMGVLIFNKYIKELTGAPVGTLNIEFSGAGDSGAIDNVVPSNPILNNFGVDFWELAEKILGLVEYDYYNNNGGYGTITYDLEQNKARIVGYQYYMEEEKVVDEEILIG